ncbi:acetylcholine receptor subunit alpha-1-A isoform X1 [Strongylocentrotus purpuratus]|uniref:Uncharacterized protein n=2 Tax=Strongylocentrotus purpuratus TaxID=7668 RepID=A0A7M7N902_STRPU|nr:acetylcholine receptor subunit alpha-1-A isoform X1 [Strongylocentrotus purpuratus]
MMETSNTVYVIVCLICLSTCVSTSVSTRVSRQSNTGLTNNSTTKALVKKLTDGYGETSVRPVYNYRQTTYVYLRMLIYELVAFNEHSQHITLRSNMKMTWRDEYLQWDPSEWDGITSVTLRPSDIWKPDFDLEQNVERVHFIVADTYVIADYTGTVRWIFPVITTTACKINIVYFPYDVQQCNVTFYPWTLDNSQMRLLAEDDDDAHQQMYIRNGVWDLTNFQAANESIPYKCCPHPFDHVVYTLDLAREAAFFTTQIVMPSVFLSILMLISFWLHPDSGEKISLTVTNLLALILFQQLVAQFMPPTGEPRSIVVTCFFILIALSACSVILTVIVLRVYHTNVDSLPPSWAFMLLRIFINRKVEKTMSAFYDENSRLKGTRDVELSTSKSPSSCEAVTESTSLKEGSINGKTNEIADSEEELDYSFMWKHLALAIERVFGIILSACMLVCVIYALVAFGSRH